MNIAFFFNLYTGFIFFLATIFFMFPVALVALFFDTKMKIKITHPFWPIYSKIILYLGCFSRLLSIDRRKDQNILATLTICNHQSALDIPLFVTKKPVAPLMKKEVLYIPFFGVVAMAAGSITVDRKNKRSRAAAFRECSKRIQEGIPLLYFPEGTRSKDARPKPFEKLKLPLLKEAYKNNFPVSPISLYGTRRVLNRKKLFQKNIMGIIAHELLYPKDYSDEIEFAKACWGKVESGFLELEQMILPQIMTNEKN